MRRHLLRERDNYPQEDVEFCLVNPTVSDWLKAVGIQSPRLIECIKSQFESIESLLSSNREYLLELLVPHDINELDQELFISSWEILQTNSSGELNSSSSQHHFSWIDCYDRMRSNIDPPPRRAGSPDPWYPDSRYPDNTNLPSISDGTSNSDPIIYPAFTPSPGPHSSHVRGSNTYPRPPRQFPNPESAQTEQLSDRGDTISEDGTLSHTTLFGSRILARLFRLKNRAPPGKGSRNSLIIEYEQEPRLPGYRKVMCDSPDRDSFHHERQIIHDEVFVDDYVHSPSYPSDTPQTDCSASPPRISSPQPTDWEINFSEIRNIKEIKSCKYSSLSTGSWHGQVLLKTYKNTLLLVRDQFQQELSALRNIRHDNVILFRGACTGDPDLTIVTSVKHAPTLHHVIRLSPKYPLERALTILKEISQAMTYLHDRKIVHQNLTTDSIYLERGNARPILFDIAINPLLEFAGVDPGSWEFPRGFVSGMAPEIIDSLSPAAEDMDRILPFSDKSDVFAFGSIWYELYTGQYPLQGDPIEVVMFKISNGFRQTLDLIIGPRCVKEELYRCWDKDPHRRPSFQNLEGIIEKLPNIQQPKKLPLRSTSHSAVIPLKTSEATM